MKDLDYETKTKAIIIVSGVCTLISALLVIYALIQGAVK